MPGLKRENKYHKGNYQATNWNGTKQEMKIRIKFIRVVFQCLCNKIQQKSASSCEFGQLVYRKNSGSLKKVFQLNHELLKMGVDGNQVQK